MQERRIIFGGRVRRLGLQALRAAHAEATLSSPPGSSSSRTQNERTQREGHRPLRAAGRRPAAEGAVREADGAGHGWLQRRRRGGRWAAGGAGGGRGGGVLANPVE